jgi:hypothetical protein
VDGGGCRSRCCPKALDGWLLHTAVKTSCGQPSWDPTSPIRSLKAGAADRKTFKEIHGDLLNLSHESIEVLQLAAVDCRTETETADVCFASTEIQSLRYREGFVCLEGCVCQQPNPFPVCLQLRWSARSPVTLSSLTGP